MGHIGMVIKEYRCMLKITRKELCEYICSEKYIYLIEKGKRTPSFNMVNMISDRLGVDLFDYYQFLDCIDPVKVYEITKKINLCQEITDFDTIMELVNQALTLPDFKTKPRLYELETNIIAHKVYSQHKYEEAATDAENLLKKIEVNYLNNMCMVNLYILLSMCHQVMGDLDNARDTAFKAYDIIRNKYNMEKYEQSIITVKINLMALYNRAGEFDRVIREGEALLQYQHEIHSCARVHYTYIYLAFAYYQTGVHDKALLYFKYAVYLLIIHHSPLDVHYITTQDIFHVMSKDKRINKEIICEFKKKYNITT